MEELIMDMWIVIGLAFVGGLLIGWYVTWQFYSRKERDREIVEDYKRHELLKRPPKSNYELVQDAIRLLESIVTKFHIEWDECKWDYSEEK